MDFKSKDIYSLIKNNIPDIKKYIGRNRFFSEIGEKAENKVAELFKGKGAEILYQGGDGDFIDMIYGADLIVGKDDKIYLAQVKSSPVAAGKSLRNAGYRGIDWFCAPTKDGIVVFTKGNPDGRELKN